MLRRLMSYRPNRQQLKRWVWLSVPPMVWSAVYGLLWLKPRLFSLSYNHLDPSYIYGVQRAAEQHEAFGQQFVSNYGPLSYAIINFLPEKLVGLTLWHLAAVLAAGCGAYWFCRLYTAANWTRPLAGALLLFALALAGPEWLYLDLFLLYAFIYLKLPVASAAKRRLLYALVAVSMLYALMKFTIGLVSISGVGLIVLSEHVPGREVIKARVIYLAKIMLAYVVGLGIVGYLLGVKNVVAYGLSSFQVASGFSGAMGINDPHLALATKYIGILFVLVLAWLVVKFKKDMKYYLFLLPALYIVFKYCVTRQDGHVLAILQVVVALAVLIYFLQRQLKASDGIFLGLILGVAAMALWTNYTDFRVVNTALVAPITNVQQGQAAEFLRLGKQKQQWRTETAAWLQTAKLSADMRAKIGTAPVDIFPWETVIAEANDLNWHNRPSPYAFETYTPALDTMDETFIRTKGPTYIIWHRFGENGALGIDGRQLLWDGPKTMDTMLRYYDVVDADQGFMLLQRRAAPLPDSTKVLAKATGDGWVKVPQSDGLVCANVAIQATLKQSISKALLRERPFFIDATYADGAVREFRFVRETAVSGLVVNPLPYDWNSLVSTLQHETLTADATDRITQLRVSNEPTATITFTPCHG